MTRRQEQILRFINAYRDKNQCNPTCEEIALDFGFASNNAAHDHLKALERKGIIKFRHGKARGYIVQFEHRS